jgi:mono/diheme cytochrome c family protein
LTWNRWAATGLALLPLAAALASYSCTGTAKSAMSAEDKLARGRRVVYTSGCMDCHTPGTFFGMPDTTRLLSGSELGWQGPWGVTYPRNLTPDSTTGIGAWTEEQIVTAVREGRRPDGTPLLPPMPWPMYAHLTDEDAYALAAYLKSIPPVVHEVPKVQRPGEAPVRPALVFPPPPEWDGRHLPPPQASATGAPAGGAASGS